MQSVTVSPLNFIEKREQRGCGFDLYLKIKKPSRSSPRVILVNHLLNEKARHAWGRVPGWSRLSVRSFYGATGGAGDSGCGVVITSAKYSKVLETSGNSSVINFTKPKSSLATRITMSVATHTW